VKKYHGLAGALAVMGLLSVAPEASAGGLELRVGGMKPRAKSILFDDSVSLYFVDKDDFTGGAGGLEFTATLAPNIELGLSVDGYGREIPTSYRDFTRPSGREIEQTLRFVTVPVSAIVRLVPTGRYRKWAPYVGGGVSAIFWQYEEFGDFIDVQAAGQPVSFDSFKSTGTKLGFVANAGLRYRLNEDFQVTADYRHFQGKQQMKGDFSPNVIDVTGDMFTVGLRITF
jgi:opacity protein-like surface antigen